MSDRRTTAPQLAAEVAQLRRRLADLEASASERHAEGVLLRAALTASVTAIAITDRTGVIEWVNPAFCTLTQYTVAEAVGKNPRELVKSGQHDPAFYKHLWDTILSGQVWRGNMINRRKDGSFYAEEQTITPVRDAQGAIRHFIAVKEDVTTRRRAEEQLREGARRSVQAEREFRGLFLANPLPMWIYDLATLRFLEVNDAAVGRYGYGREEFLTLTIKDIRPSEDQDLLVTHISQPRDPWQSAGNWRHRFKSGGHRRGSHVAHHHLCRAAGRPGRRTGHHGTQAGRRDTAGRGRTHTVCAAERQCRDLGHGLHHRGAPMV
jgi:PAS domain S-box-containing protein